MIARPIDRLVGPERSVSSSKSPDWSLTRSGSTKIHSASAIWHRPKAIQTRLSAYRMSLVRAWSSLMQSLSQLTSWPGPNAQFPRPKAQIGYILNLTRPRSIRPQPKSIWFRPKTIQTRPMHKHSSKNPTGSAKRCMCRAKSSIMLSRPHAHVPKCT